MAATAAECNGGSAGQTSPVRPREPVTLVRGGPKVLEDREVLEQLQ